MRLCLSCRSVLSMLPDGLGSPNAPIHVFLQLEESALVLELRSQIAALTARNEELQRQLNQVQYRYGCEVTLCNELVDLCRKHKVPYRKSIDRWLSDTNRRRF